MRMLHIGPSSIHGFGLFATIPLRRHVCIGEYTGERLSNAEAEVRFANEPDCCFEGHTLQFELNDNEVIDGGVGGGPLVYVNHSSQPNCSVRFRGGRIYFYTKRAVRRGEELTIDYDCGCENCSKARQAA